MVDAYDVLMNVDGREDRKLSIGDVVCVSEAAAADPLHRAARRTAVLGSAAPEVGAAAVMTEVARELPVEEATPQAAEVGEAVGSEPYRRWPRAGWSS